MEDTAEDTGLANRPCCLGQREDMELPSVPVLWISREPPSASRDVRDASPSPCLVNLCCRPAPDGAAGEEEHPPLVAADSAGAFAGAAAIIAERESNAAFVDEARTGGDEAPNGEGSAAFATLAQFAAFAMLEAPAAAVALLPKVPLTLPPASAGSFNACPAPSLEDCVGPSLADGGCGCCNGDPPSEAYRCRENLAELGPAPALGELPPFSSEAYRCRGSLAELGPAPALDELPPVTSPPAPSPALVQLPNPLV